MKAMPDKLVPASAKWVFLAGLAMLVGIIYLLLNKGAELLLELAVGAKPGGWFGGAFFLSSLVVAFLLTRRRGLS
jgi:hypothetical protein